VTPDRTVRRREIEDSTAARLAEIVAAAEQAAKQVIDEAEEEARNRLSDANEEADRIVAERLAGLAELTEEIDAQAEVLRRQAEALQRAIAEAKAELGGAESPGGSVLKARRESDPDLDPDQDVRRPTGPALTVVGGLEPEAAPPRERAEEADAPTGSLDSRSRGTGPQDFDADASNSVDTPAGARLLATQMAVSGSSRDEIEARLRNGFAITDTRSILDAILGPEK
jgi:vacuolar-type H+-ATPase subunit H